VIGVGAFESNMKSAGLGLSQLA